jgi:octaprenyl-diphosphate synthase
VALSARVGTGFDQRALDLATAVELVHNATLLHDDVIDLAESRRGAPTARAEFGNAASIFAGDWLLIEALRRVQRAALPGLLDLLLETISEMIRAEALQLEHRGRIDTSRELYFEVPDGKSATVFAWAMHAGATAGDVEPDACAALRAYGVHLGLAFQVVDDLLDLIGGPAGTGKARFNDLREGKMTFPVIVALERDPSLRPVLEAVLRPESPAAPAQDHLERIREAVIDTGSELECRELAGERVGRAIAAIARLPASEVTAALAMVARSTVGRIA